MKDKILTILFWLSVVLLTIMSLTFMFMPMAVRMVVTTMMPIKVLGLTFWISAILGYLCVLFAVLRRRKLLHEYKVECQKRPGILTVFSNPIAKVMDVLLLISLVAYIIINFTSYNATDFAFVILSILVFSLNMHCLFNGRIYKNL